MSNDDKQNPRAAWRLDHDPLDPKDSSPSKLSSMPYLLALSGLFMADESPAIRARRGTLADLLAPDSDSDGDQNLEPFKTASIPPRIKTNRDPGLKRERKRQFRTKKSEAKKSRGY